MSFHGSTEVLLFNAAGFVLLLLFMLWQGFAARHLDGYEPMFGALITADERLRRIDDLETKVSTVVERIDDLDRKQVHHIQVTRANSRALDDDRDVTVDSDAADQYLISNGVPVSELTEMHTDDTDDDT